VVLRERFVLDIFIPGGGGCFVCWGVISKENSAEFFFFFPPPPFLFPRVHPRLTRRLIKPSAPDKKYWGD